MSKPIFCCTNEVIYRFAYAARTTSTNQTDEKNNLGLHEDEPRAGKKANKTCECAVFIFPFCCVQQQKMQIEKRSSSPYGISSTVLHVFWLCRWYTNHVDCGVEGSFCNVMSGLLRAMVKRIKGL